MIHQKYTWIISRQNYIRILQKFSIISYKSFWYEQDIVVCMRDSLLIGHWQPLFKTIKSSVGCLFEGIWLCLEQIIKWIVYLCSITLINYLFHHLLSLIIKVIIKSLEITLRWEFYRFFDTLILKIFHPRTSILSNAFVEGRPHNFQIWIKSNEYLIC